MKKLELTGVKIGRLEALMPAWVNNKGQQVWMCVCDCLQIRFITAGAFKSRNRESCGCLHSEVSSRVIKELNADRKGKPLTSEKALAAVRDACKIMNAVRRSKARHVLSNIDPEKLTAECHICGKVPIKVMKHRAKAVLRDQYLCWVGSLRVNNTYDNAKVLYRDHALEMFEQQHNMCAICGGLMIRGDALANDGMVLDHCHKTGFIRGFLHQGCNKGLGSFKDNPDSLQNASEYILRSVKELELQLSRGLSAEMS
jgi:hypothetical protein